MIDRSIVVGLGNPLLGDDGVGWRVADELERRIGPDARVVVERAALGGLSLMERLVGYDAAVIVDAVQTGDVAPGSVLRAPLEAFGRAGAGHTTSPHDVSLATALAVGRAIGAELPATIEIVGIEIRHSLDVSETLTPSVAASVPAAAAAVLAYLGCPCAAPLIEPREEERNHGVTRAAAAVPAVCLIGPGAHECHRDAHR